MSPGEYLDLVLRLGHREAVRWCRTNGHSAGPEAERFERFLNGGAPNRTDLQPLDSTDDESEGDDVDTVLTSLDVARRLKVSERTVSNLVARGELEPVRIGRRMVRFTPAEVDAFVERNRGGDAA